MYIYILILPGLGMQVCVKVLLSIQDCYKIKKGDEMFLNFKLGPETISVATSCQIGLCINETPEH